MGGSYVNYDEVDPGYVDQGVATGGDQVRKRRKRKHYTTISDSIMDVLAEEAARVEALPEPPKPTVKRKKHIARQIVIAAGKFDLLPALIEHEPEAIAIGTKAVEAIANPLEDAAAKYQAIVEMIAELQRLADEDEADVERLLFEYDQRQYAAIAELMARFT